MEETISPAKDEGAQINSYFVSDAIDHHHMECVKKGCVVSILMMHVYRSLGGCEVFIEELRIIPKSIFWGMIIDFCVADSHCNISCDHNGNGDRYGDGDGVVWRRAASNSRV